jgi:hypothetical protein
VLDDDDALEGQRARRRRRTAGQRARRRRTAGPACSTTTTHCRPARSTTTRCRTGVLNEPQNRGARRRQGRVASLAPRSGGLRPSLTSPARADGSHLRRVQAPVVRRQASHRIGCHSHCRWLTGVALWTDGCPRNASTTPSWRPVRHVLAPELRSRQGPRARCSTSASRSGGALRREQLQHADRRRNFRWCSSPLRLVTS